MQHNRFRFRDQLNSNPVNLTERKNFFRYLKKKYFNWVKNLNFNYNFLFPSFRTKFINFYHPLNETREVFLIIKNRLKSVGGTLSMVGQNKKKQRFLNIIEFSFFINLNLNLWKKNFFFEELKLQSNLFVYEK